MKVLDLFAGIGGFSLAAHWMGWETAAFVEREPFCQKVLRKNFGEDIEIHDDIFDFDGRPFRGAVDIITGGFPCQPFSAAGKRKGADDERYLWPEMLRTIREVQPRYVVGENVLGLLNQSRGMVFETVHTDLETAGYEVFTLVLPACAVGAQTRRDRVWIVGRLSHASGIRFGESEIVSKRQQSARRRPSQRVVDALYRDDSRQYWRNESSFTGVVERLPGRMDRIRSERIRAVGNSIVPQLAFEIFRAIEAADK